MCYTYLAGLVITDGNGLIYMRARYYSPDMRRFINADVVAGDISNAITLNRFAYANGNPVSFVDPFGLSVFSWINDKLSDVSAWFDETINNAKESIDDGLCWIDNNIILPGMIFYYDITEDMRNFDWNNTNERTVLRSNYFSAYREKLVLRFGINSRSGSFGVLFIDLAEDERIDRIQTVQHEYGHTKQLDELGLVNYLLYVAVPSYLKWGPEDYYHKPWEIIADIYGEVDVFNRPGRDAATQDNIDNGYEYMKFVGNDDYSMLAKLFYIAHGRHLNDSLESFFKSFTNDNREK